MIFCNRSNTAVNIVVYNMIRQHSTKYARRARDPKCSRDDGGTRLLSSTVFENAVFEMKKKNATSEQRTKQDLSINSLTGLFISLVISVAVLIEKKTKTHYSLSVV